jgi:hypothetical protein
VDRPACAGIVQVARRSGRRRRVRRGVARTPPVTASVTGGRALQIVRATYGVALVLVPGPAIRLATGRLPSRQACRVMRVLGTRHLIQAALTAAAPEPAVLALGGQVDTVHTASMLLLATVSPVGRRAALTDALTEAAFATAGFSASGGRFGQPHAE